LRFRVLL